MIGRMGKISLPEMWHAITFRGDGRRLSVKALDSLLYRFATSARPYENSHESLKILATLQSSGNPPTPRHYATCLATLTPSSLVRYYKSVLTPFNLHQHSQILQCIILHLGNAIFADQSRSAALLVLKYLSPIFRNSPEPSELSNDMILTLSWIRHHILRRSLHQKYPTLGERQTDDWIEVELLAWFSIIKNTGISRTVFHAAIMANLDAGDVNNALSLFHSPPTITSTAPNRYLFNKKINSSPLLSNANLHRSTLPFITTKNTATSKDWQKTFGIYAAFRRLLDSFQLPSTTANLIARCVQLKIIDVMTVVKMTDASLSPRCIDLIAKSLESDYEALVIFLKSTGCYRGVADVDVKVQKGSLLDLKMQPRVLLPNTWAILARSMLRVSPNAPELWETLKMLDFYVPETPGLTDAKVVVIVGLMQHQASITLPSTSSVTLLELQKLFFTFQSLNSHSLRPFTIVLDALARAECAFEMVRLWNHLWSGHWAVISPLELVGSALKSPQTLPGKLKNLELVPSVLKWVDEHRSQLPPTEIQSAKLIRKSTRPHPTTNRTPIPLNSSTRNDAVPSAMFSVILDGLGRMKLISQAHVLWRNAMDNRGNHHLGIQINLNHCHSYIEAMIRNGQVKNAVGAFIDTEKEMAFYKNPISQKTVHSLLGLLRRHGDYSVNEQLDHFIHDKYPHLVRSRKSYSTETSGISQTANE